MCLTLLILGVSSWFRNVIIISLVFLLVITFPVYLKQMSVMLLLLIRGMVASFISISTVISGLGKYTLLDRNK